jgi:hypothetical protein
MEEMDKLSSHSHSHASRNVERSQHHPDTSPTRLSMIINECHFLKLRVVTESGYVTVIGPLHVEKHGQICPSEYASNVAL